MNHTHSFQCPHCLTLYSKGLRRDDEATYGEGAATCEACNVVMEKWHGFEPVYIPVETAH